MDKKLDLCIMMAPHISMGDKPDFVHIVGHDVEVTDFDTFMDAGFQYEYRIVVVGEGTSFEDHSDAYWAYDYFYGGCDSGEYGSPTEPFEDEHRRKHFATLWEFITGEQVVFKGVA